MSLLRTKRIGSANTEHFIFICIAFPTNIYDLFAADQEVDELRITVIKVNHHSKYVERKREIQE